jgi:hypothetical protein
MVDDGLQKVDNVIVVSHFHSNSNGGFLCFLYHSKALNPRPISTQSLSSAVGREKASIEEKENRRQCSFCARGCTSETAQQV